MDAVKFVEEAKRMCHANIDNCADCFKGVACPICLTGEYHTPAERVKIVEEWSAAHPRKTRQSVFLEQYPETILDEYGVVTICPVALSSAHRNSNGWCKGTDDTCIICRREFWMQEVE